LHVLVSNQVIGSDLDVNAGKRDSAGPDHTGSQGP